MSRKGLACLFVAASVLLSASLLITFLTSDRHEAAVKKVPAPEMIRRIEANLRLPHEARPLGAYVRYYATDTVDNAAVVRGVFVYDGAPGRIVRVQPDQVPRIADGGCDVIEMLYSPEAGKILSVFCHGAA